MPPDDLDPILIQVTVPLPVHMIYAAFLEPTQLTQWLCDEAVVEPVVRGRYELTFRGDSPHASRGTVTHLTPDVDVGFTWSPPPAFQALMEPVGPSQVYVRLADSPEGIDVTLEHIGWKSGEEWEEARSWHFHLWDDRLGRLKTYLLRAAYG